MWQSAVRSPHPKCQHAVHNLKDWPTSFVFFSILNEKIAQKIDSIPNMILAKFLKLALLKYSKLVILSLYLNRIPDPALNLKLSFLITIAMSFLLRSILTAVKA